MPALYITYWICLLAAITAVLCLVLRAYIMMARRLGITNGISNKVVTGGGIIIPLACIAADIYSAHHFFLYPYFLTGIVIIATISFIDDIYDVSPWLRLGVHFACAVLLLLQMGVEAPWIEMPWWLCAIVVVGIVALVNTFNFIDGIKGITGCYSLAVLLPCYLTFIPVNEMVFLCITAAIIAFCCFNFSTPERCYCGDTGSISIGYFAAFLILCYASLSPVSGNVPQPPMLIDGLDLTAIIFVIVYLIDSSFTLTKRILRRENIFTAHRCHIYQRLAFEAGVPHMRIAIGYAATQAAISVAYVIAPPKHHLTVLIVSAVALAAAYCFISSRLNAAAKSRHRELCNSH